MLVSDASSNAVVAIDRFTGQEAWRFRGLPGYVGFQEAPLVRGGRVYAASGDTQLVRSFASRAASAFASPAIIGGRNIGDEYFDATEGTAFVDLDVLAVGPVVREVSADFDRYWASGSSYPVDRLLPPTGRASTPTTNPGAHPSKSHPSWSEVAELYPIPVLTFRMRWGGTSRVRSCTSPPA